MFMSQILLGFDYCTWVLSVKALKYEISTDSTHVNPLPFIVVWLPGKYCVL